MWLLCDMTRAKFWTIKNWKEKKKSPFALSCTNFVITEDTWNSLKKTRLARFEHLYFLSSKTSSQRWSSASLILLFFVSFLHSPCLKSVSKSIKYELKSERKGQHNYESDFKLKIKRFYNEREVTYEEAGRET